ncbi:MAG: DUF512 domain-containing protein [Gemmatimonadota bacterium]
MIRVKEVRRGSISQEIGIRTGTLLLRLNGEELRDSLDLLFLQADERLVLEAESPTGAPQRFEIEKDPDTALGIVPEPEKIRRCTNACPFCFVKGNPKATKLRAGLYIKDDDYRLSFLHGHYITLTNLREEDWDRILAQRLSPLYISVHAIEPEVRLAMLKNPRAADIDAHLTRLEAGGIQYHAQVVLCPGINDGDHLSHTIDALYGRGEAVLSLSIVPVGLTVHNADRGVRPLAQAEARAALARVGSARERALHERGKGWCYAGDEMFLLAGREPPGPEYFDDPELVANGVGAVTALRERIHRDLAELPPWNGARIVLITGTAFGPTLERLAHRIAVRCGARIATVVRENSLYGASVTSAGLLCGRDHLEAIRPYAESDLVLFSGAALDSEARFLDDLSLAELRRTFPGCDICPSEHVTDVLARA